MTLPTSDDGGGDADSGTVADVGLIVPCCDGSELLEFGEVVFDEMAPAIHLPVVVDAEFSVGF